MTTRAFRNCRKKQAFETMFKATLRQFHHLDNHGIMMKIYECNECGKYHLATPKGVEKPWELKKTMKKPKERPQYKSQDMPDVLVAKLPLTYSKWKKKISIPYKT